MERKTKYNQNNNEDIGIFGAQNDEIIGGSAINVIVSRLERIVPS